MSLDYLVFGLRLRSNSPLPGICPLQSRSDNIDLHLHLGVSPAHGEPYPTDGQEVLYTSSDKSAAGVPCLQISRFGREGLLSFAYEDGAQFWLDRKGENLWSVWLPGLTLDSIATYLFGPILGNVLRLRGITCLHASAVTLDNHCVVFVGPPGAGKSTTAAAFAREGYPVLSDDIVAFSECNGAFYALPAYPFLCLWPESVELIYGNSEALPLFIPEWDKRRLSLGLHGTRFEDRTLPLAAIYVLGERRPGQPSIEPIPAKQAMLSLLVETYANKILDREMRSREFLALGRLLEAFPVRRIHASADFPNVASLCAVIREDFSQLRISAAAQR